jgi:DNA-directed RNA polymerase specialized sigma subunit
MEINEIKKYLKRISVLDKNINDKMERLYELRLEMTGVQAISYSEKVQTSCSGDKIGDVVAKVIDTECEVDSLIDIMAEEKQRIANQISLLSNTRHKEVLYLKYIELRSISEIAEMLEITVRGVKKAHRKALEDFGKTLDTQYLEKC